MSPSCHTSVCTHVSLLLLTSAARSLDLSQLGTAQLTLSVSRIRGRMTSLKSRADTIQPHKYGARPKRPKILNFAVRILGLLFKAKS